MSRQLYLAVDDAMWLRITVRDIWVESRPITHEQALDHITPDGLKRVLAGKDMIFTEKDQSTPILHQILRRNTE
jgi:hypothetical protein